MEWRIPRKLFQFWHDSTAIPEHVRRAIDAKVAQHPEFEHTLADDASMLDHIERHHGARELDLYMRNRIPASRSDLARLMLLFEHGGFYVDAAWELRRTLVSLGDPDTELVLVRGPFGPLWNGLLGVPPRHPLIARTLDRALRNLEMGHFNRHVSAATGPMCLNAVVERFGLPEKTMRHALVNIGVKSTLGPAPDAPAPPTWWDEEHDGILRPPHAPAPTGPPARTDRVSVDVLLDADADFLASVRRTGAATVGPLPPPADRAMNAWLTGDADTSWEAHLAKRGPFRRVALMTSGSLPSLELFGAVRAESVTVYAPVARVAEYVTRELSSAEPRLRVDSAGGPLHPLAMPENAFDLVLSMFCIHRALEHRDLFDTLSRSLVPGGIFALFEYVCEDSFLFSPRRLARATELARTLGGVLGSDPGPAVMPPPCDVEGPLGAVRASRILPTARERFHEFHAATCLVATLPLLLMGHPRVAEALAAGGSERTRAVEALVAYEDALLEAGEQGAVAYAVYGRRT